MALSRIHTEELEGDLILERLESGVMNLHGQFSIGDEDQRARLVWYRQPCLGCHLLHLELMDYRDGIAESFSCPCLCCQYAAFALH